MPSLGELTTSHARSEALATLLDDAVRDGLPGALMLVHEADQVFYGAAGVPDLGEPERVFRVCHLMPIKSITKTFVAVRVLQMVEENLLGLDDPISTLLPAHDLRDLPNTQRIFVRHLLNHTAGIRHYPELLSYVTEFLNEPELAHSRAAALDAVRGLDPYFEPGEGYHYSNTHTLLLQLIIERMSGRSLEQELRESIWTPLGMEHSHLHDDQPLSNHVPQGYMDLYGNGDAHQIYTLDDVSSAAGGMESTLADLARFSHGLFQSERLLSPSMRDEMLLTTPVDKERWGYSGAGLGLKRWDTPLGEVFGHTGEDTGYKAYWHYAPARQLTWVLLTNANYGKFEALAVELRQDVLELLAHAP
jgi:D-alanyl-D-alanine carboxypeptidase